MDLIKKYSHNIAVMIILFAALITMYPTKSSAAGMPFTVDAILPDNQVTLDNIFFDLKVKPSQQQELEFEVSNTADRDIKIAIDLNPGWTNQNGVLSYAQTDKKVDESLKTPITKLIKDSTRTIYLEKGETKSVYFTLNVPSEEFLGIIIGGFTFKEVQKDDEKKNTSNDVVIKNEIQLVKGIRIRESDQEILEKLTINSAKAQLISYKRAFTINVQNPQPDFARDITLKIDVYKGKSKKPIVSEEKIIPSMAPNSSTDLPVFYDEALKSGEYRLKVNVKTPKFKTEAVRNFNVSHQKAKKLNKEVDEVMDPKSNWQEVTILILLSCSIFSVLIIKIYKKGRIKNEKK